MKTPICDFCKKYADNRAIRLHMPGHKGKIGGVSSFDITEIDGADSLYEASGIIKESEENASRLFGSALTLFSTEGSSQVIRAMIYLAKVRSGGDDEAYILAMRNAHKTFAHAVALLDIGVKWLFGGDLLTCNVTAAQINDFLCEAKKKPIAVYITTPDYLGNMLDVKAIAEVCHSHGVMLIVDNAHGAYLKFLSPSRHPIDLGADMCCDSAHKTLSGLTGTAYLHISKNAPKYVFDEAKNAMSIFGSTSPSYVLLMSLDGLNEKISDDLPKFLSTEKMVKSLKNRLIERHFNVISDEPFKITVLTKSFGYLGNELYSLLKDGGIVAEFCDKDNLVMMFSNENEEWEYEKIFDVFSSIPRKDEIVEKPPKILPSKQKMSATKALLSPKEWVNVKDSVGRILAAANVSCPPAVPIVFIGEEISSDAIAAMEYYGIDKCLVVK